MLGINSTLKQVSAILMMSTGNLAPLGAKHAEQHSAATVCATQKYYTFYKNTEPEHYINLQTADLCNTFI